MEEFKITYPQSSIYYADPGTISPTTTEPVSPRGESWVTGTLYEDNYNKARPEVMIGDLNNNKEYRGFISFDISNIPLSAISSAELYLNPLSYGDMDSQYFRKLIIETVNIGNYLDKTDFDKDKIIADKDDGILFKDIGKKPHNVTKEIIKLKNDGKDIATFRLRFSEHTDGNNKQDKLTITTRDNKTYLRINYK